MKTKKWISLLLAFAMVFALAACNKESKSPDVKQPESKSSEVKQPELTIDELQDKIDEQSAKIYAILDEHDDLWNRLYEQTDDADNESYDKSTLSPYLKALLESHKDLLSNEEHKVLTEDIEKIIVIEKEIDELEEMYVKLLKESGANSERQTSESFPVFKGKDLDGNEVDSAALFGGNKVTVVNFWFSSCKPCVEELKELNALNEQLKEKGGAVIGINVDTLDGNQTMIDEAKKILEQNGAAYQNIWFDSASDAGKFSGKIMGFPTTYVVDSNGNIVGEPLMGGINHPGMMELLQVQISAALGEDVIPYEGTSGSPQS